MEESQWLSFRSLPHSENSFSDLFADYTSDFSKLQHHYEADFRPAGNFPRLAERRRPEIRHREEIAEILMDQNSRYGASDLTFEHIRQLRDENTFAIVTGQQVGLFTGPLYTIYKTITAIKLARTLTESHPQYRFIPVFWLEGEDHDFEEVNHVGLLNSDHVPVRVEYVLKGKSPQKNLSPVGEIPFDASLDAFFEEISRTLPSSEFKESLIAMLRSAYQADSTFNRSFCCLMNRLFANDGVVFVSSNDHRIKRLLSPVFLKEIQEFPRVSQLIIAQSAELEERYHAQVKPKAMNLFLLSRGGRYFIEPREKDFSLKGTRQYLTRDDLLKIVNDTPEMLSPNVVLRPICQDTMLPTVAYVGGPSEVAYFAQLKSIYGYFGLTMPIIYPRASATIVEEKQRRVMEKYQIEITEFFSDGERINRKVVQMLSEIRIDEMFENGARRIREIIDEMRFGLNYIDSTLLDPLETTREKIDSHFSLLREKVVEAQKRKHEIALRQVTKAVNTLHPNHAFQERELNVITFMNKYGTDFVGRLMAEVEINRFQHQILHV